MARFVRPSNVNFIEKIYSDGDKISYLDETRFEDIADEFEKLKPYMSRIPVKEQEILYMHFVLRKKQTEIAAIYNRTQAAISYRIKKAILRIKFLDSLHKDISEDSIRKDLSHLFSSDDLAILVGMYRHTCQTQVAKDIGSDQCRVRHRFYKYTALLEEMSRTQPELEKYSDLFKKIRDNTCILREVKLSRWDHGTYIVDAC